MRVVTRSSSHYRVRRKHAGPHRSPRIKPEKQMSNVNAAMLLRFHKLALLSGALLGAGYAQQAAAQATGTDVFEEGMTEVVVTATRTRQIGLVGDQTVPK